MPVNAIDARGQKSCVHFLNRDRGLKSSVLKVISRVCDGALGRQIVSRHARIAASAPGRAPRPRQRGFGRRNAQSIAARRRRVLGQTGGLLLARCRGVFPHVAIPVASFRRGLGQRGATFLQSSGGFPGFARFDDVARSWPARPGAASAWWRGWRAARQARAPGKAWLS